MIGRLFRVVIILLQMLPTVVALSGTRLPGESGLCSAAHPPVVSPVIVQVLNNALPWRGQ